MRGHADFLVELRGFEPMAIAGTVRSPAIRLFTSQCARWFLANYEGSMRRAVFRSRGAHAALLCRAGDTLRRRRLGRDEDRVHAGRLLTREETIARGSDRKSVV